MMDLQDFIQILHDVDYVVNRHFLAKHCRKAELADKQQKVIEECGEVIRALKPQNEKPVSILEKLYRRDQIVDEIMDSVIAAMGQAFVLGFTDHEVLESLQRVLVKLKVRWNLDDEVRITTKGCSL